MNINKEKKRNFGPKFKKFEVLSRRTNGKKKAFVQKLNKNTVQKAKKNFRVAGAKHRFVENEPTTSASPVRIAEQDTNAKKTTLEVKSKCEGGNIENCADHETEERPHHLFGDRKKEENQAKEEKPHGHTRKDEIHKKEEPQAIVGIVDLGKDNRAEAKTETKTEVVKDQKTNTNTSESYMPMHPPHHTRTALLLGGKTCPSHNKR